MRAGAGGRGRRWDRAARSRPGAGARLGAMRGQLCKCSRIHHTPSCQEEPQGSPSQASSRHGITMPRVPELSQAPHMGPQEGSSIPSSAGTAAAGEAAREAAEDLPRVSPATAGPTDTEPAAPTLPGAAEQEQHRTPLGAVAQEEALAEQAAAQAPAPRRLSTVDRALQVSFMERRPSCFRRAMNSLGKTSSFSCTSPQEEE